MVMRWIDAICCNGCLCSEYVKSLGYPEDRISYGHMAADVIALARAISTVSQEQVAELFEECNLNGVVFLYVGQLVSRKGVLELLRGWALFSSGIAQNHATLMLVGDGPQRAELERFCVENRLENVHFVGPVDYDEIAPYYRTADVFVIPTLEDNWSLVVPEAMACSLPILCSKYNGCWPELVQIGRSGWVFDPLDEADLVAKIQRSFEKRKFLRQMGEMSKSIVQNYTPKRAAESILKACEIALDSRGIRRCPEKV
jgi:glycosyltransferase involved in cell wall biosynthesis